MRAAIRQVLVPFWEKNVPLIWGGESSVGFLGRFWEASGTLQGNCWVALEGRVLGKLALSIQGMASEPFQGLLVVFQDFSGVLLGGFQTLRA